MKRIALTFDDGPNTVTTPLILDLLEEYGIPASFFLIADNINDESAKVVRRALSLGCEIANHSRTHGHMDQMTAEQIREEVRYCTEKITAITGRAPSFFRPPYIAVNQTVFDNVDLTFIFGAGCEDWVPEVSARERAERVLADARDGNIVLLHDSAGNDNTVEALKTIIPALKERGYAFRTCSQLFAECGVTPVRGFLYSNVFQTTGRP